MKKKLIVTGVIAVIVFGLGFYAYWHTRTAPALSALPDLRNAPAAASEERFAKPSVPLEGMEGVVSNGKLSLYYDKETMAIAVRDPYGTVWRSSPEKLDDDPLANASVKDQLSSQIIVNYSNRTGQESSKTSNQDSVQLKQATATPIDGGLKVTYTIGKAESELDSLPKQMSAERYKKLIDDKVGKKYERYLFVAYQNTPNKDVYVRNDKQLTALRLTKVREAFLEAGYTAEDLAIDNGTDGQAEDREVFAVSVEYTLQGDQLVARIPTSEVQYTKTYQLTDITLLPYFGAADTQDQGYMFVPDGSGSLINLNNGKERYEAYIQPVYGDDGATWDGEYDDDPTIEPIRLPVFGMKKNDAAFLAIIDQGEAVATIHAQVSKLKSSYNAVYPSFQLLAKERINLSATTNDLSTKSKEIPVFQQRPVYADFSVRYAFLRGDQANYAGMATYYRQYLERKQVLKKLPERTETPFYLELVGGITKPESLLGVPYDSVVALTTFDQAKEILDALKDKGITSVKLRLSGWFNKGVHHEVADHISVDGALGGGKGFKELLAYAKRQGITVYPDVSFTHLYWEADNDSRFSDAKAAARQVNRYAAWVWERTDWARPLSARLVPYVVDSFLEDYAKYGQTGISLRNMAHMLEGDYRHNHVVDRSQSQQIDVDQLEKISGRLPDIMVDGGNAYAFKYAKDIVAAPLTNNNYNITDEAVPFYQIVLHGYIDYTGAPLNLSPEGDVKKYILKSLEYGSNVYFKWFYADNSEIRETRFLDLYSVHYKTWMNEAVESYGKVNEVLGDVQRQAIVDHRKLARGVYRTTYEGGKSIIVNYNPYEVTVSGRTIAAKDYFVGGDSR
ncbi:MAG: hypothetical protein J7559_05690 [Cohnella sp.]|nr:hypothetical protein [Cohnella sp.]